MVTNPYLGACVCELIPWVTGYFSCPLWNKVVHANCCGPWDTESSTPNPTVLLEDPGVQFSPSYWWHTHTVSSPLFPAPRSADVPKVHNLSLSFFRAVMETGISEMLAEKPHLWSYEWIILISHRVLRNQFVLHRNAICSCALYMRLEFFPLLGTCFITEWNFELIGLDPHHLIHFNVCAPNPSFYRAHHPHLLFPFLFALHWGVGKWVERPSLRFLLSSKQTPNHLMNVFGGMCQF